MTPDDNSPTQPSPTPVKGPQPYDWFGNDPALPMTPATNLPPATNDGKPPIWNVAEPAPAAPASPGSLRGFGIGFAIALMVLGVMVLGLVIFLSASKGSPDIAQQFTPTPTSSTNSMTPVPTALPPLSVADADNVTTQFYVSYLGAGQYQNAYNLLSDDLKSKQSLQQFQQVWQNTIQVTINAGSLQTTQANDGKSVNVTVAYTQLTQKSGSGISSHVFNSTLMIAYDKTGQPRITNINAVETTPTVTPTAQPTATTQPTATPVAVTPSPSPTSGTTPTAIP